MPRYSISQITTVGQSFADDTGWRIDYQLATPGLARAAVAAGPQREPPADQPLSGTAPGVRD